MKEQLEKDLQKHKKVIILSVLGFFASVLLVVYYYLQNDNRFIAFILVLGIDIYELQKEIKQYRKIKSELQK